MIRKADAILEGAESKEEPATHAITEETNVSFYVPGGGTSGLLANALNKAAEEYGALLRLQLEVMALTAKF